MSDFKIGDKVKVQMGASFVEGSVGMSGTVNDIFGNPIGKVGYAGTLVDDGGKIIGNVTRAFKPVNNPSLPFSSNPASPTFNPGPPAFNPAPPKFESFEQKQLRDHNLKMQSIEGEYDWLKK